MKVREGYKMTELGEIPDEWEVTILKDIVSICYGKSQKEVECKNGKYKILGTGGVIGLTNRFLYDRPSVLIGRKGTINKPMYIEEPFWTVDTLFYTKILKNYVKWFYYTMCNIDLLKYNEATGVPSLSINSLNFIKISVPPMPEQQKIAEILSTNDELISKTDEMIEKTKEIKKGLMQELMNRGIGHTEFKNSKLGKIPLEWGVIKLKDITSTITKGTTPTTYGFNFVNEGINFIKIESINDKIGKFFSETFAKINNECHEKLSRSKLKEGDILFAIAGATIGKSSIVTKDILPANTNQALAIIRLNESICREFVFCVIRSSLIQGIIINLKSNTAQPNLNLEQIGQFKIPIPPLEEQKQIASILTSVDNKIEALEKRKQKLEEIKKGLMQDLLTGRVRVKID